MKTSSSDPESPSPIVVFVAMPYSNMGAHAKWSKPQKAEAFYEQVCRRIEGSLNRPVELRIEKYSAESGLVIDGMFRAIRDADVFIADLTGSNANVFLELGIRFGVSQGVTILTTQEEQSPPFDLNQMRIVRYANGPTQDAEEAITRIVHSELGTGHRGSPVLNMLNMEVVDRAKWQVVAGIRVATLIRESKRTADARERLRLVREAVDVDPFSLDARIELTRVLRIRGEFEEGLQAFEQAVRMFPGSASLHKERGMILDRMTAQGDDRLDAAIQAYQQAISLDGKDADLHGCMGGVLRRKGLKENAVARRQILESAMHHYQTSMSLERHSTYAGLNVLRLLMLMSDSPSELRRRIGDYMTRMYHLCAFEVADSDLNTLGGHWWKMFDLGDVLAMKNESDEAIDVYRKAIDLVPATSVADTLISPIRSWTELITSGNLEAGVCKNAECILSLLEQHLNQAE